VWDGHLKSQKNPDRLNRSIHVDRIGRCTQYICLYICCAAGFDDLGSLFFSFNMSFLFRKVADVTTISESQKLTSVSIKDCTLRVSNKTTTLFLYEQ